MAATEYKQKRTRHSQAKNKEPDRNALGGQYKGRRRYYEGGFTFLERAFVDSFVGTPVETARLMREQGVSITDTYAGQLVSKDHILKAIQERGDYPHRDKLIATREDRQVFWTQIMLDEERDIADRLKASELLGKSQCDFVQKIETKGAEDHEAFIKHLALEDKVKKIERALLH